MGEAKAEAEEEKKIKGVRATVSEGQLPHTARIIKARREKGNL